MLKNYRKNKTDYIAILGRDQFESLELITQSWLKGYRIKLVGDKAYHNASYISRHIPFLGRYIMNSIAEYKIDCKSYHGLWPEVNNEVRSLTLKFYKHYVKPKFKLIDYYNRILKTEKFEAFVQKAITYEIFDLLEQFYPIKPNSKSKKLLMIKNPINKFIIEYVEEKYGTRYQVKWIRSFWGGLLSLTVYYKWLFTEFMRRGIIFNKKKKEYKLAKEAVWGFKRPTLRDDFAIDNRIFKPKDILLIKYKKGALADKAFKEAKERGFETVSAPELKINIKRNVLSFYFLLPFGAYFKLFMKKEICLFRYIFSFHKKCFPAEVLMNLYDIKCHLSHVDNEDIATTIILNKYGAKNIVFLWSDMSYFDYKRPFMAHNVYFGWGSIHDSHNPSTFLVDKRIDVGCIFKKAFKEALNNKKDIVSNMVNFNPGKKTVTFFDSSYGKVITTTPDFMLTYLELVKDFCRENREINVLLKPKKDIDYEVRMALDDRHRCREIWKELAACDNFVCVDPARFGLEEIIAISDICITMGMKSPATIALICNKNALYFDCTGNIDHPFARKYKDMLVFEDKKRLFEQIHNVLNGKFKCRDVISESEIREYDAYDDDNALERLRKGLWELSC